MTTTKPASKQNISAPSFTIGEFTKSQSTGFVLGFALIIAAGALVWLGGQISRFYLDTEIAARQVMVVSNLAMSGAENFQTGESSALGKAVEMRVAADAAVRASTDTVFGAGFELINPSYSRFKKQWGALRANLEQIGKKTALADAFSLAMSSQIDSISKLNKRLEGGKISQRGAESLAKLSAYSESGIGLASVGRAEYEIRMAAFHLVNTEVKPEWSSIERVIAGPAKSAVSIQVATTEIQAVGASAKDANTGAQLVGNAVTTSKLVPILFMLAAIAFLSGPGILALSMKRGVEGYAFRYKLATEKFVGGEEAVVKIGTAMQAVLAGNLDVKMASRGDEFASIYKMMVQLVEKIRQGNADFKKLLANAGLSDEALMRVNESFAASTAVSNELSESLATFMLEVVRIDIDAKAADFAATLASERAGDSDQVMRDSMSRTETMRDAMQDALKNVKRLGERSMEMFASIDNFSQITEQIGVLYLNASLEAERAGEHGKGFRVVANEVRTLARRSEESVDKLSKLLHGVQSDARIAAEAVDRSTSQIVAGSHIGVVADSLSASLGAVLTNIASISTAISAGSGRVRHAAHGASVSIEKSGAINETISAQLLALSGHTATSMDHAKASTERFAATAAA